MGRIAIVMCSLLTLVCLTLTSVAAAPSAVPAASTALSAGAARTRDIALVAKAKGWTVAEAAEQARMAEVIGEIAVRVAKERPDAFVGSALATKPGGPPTLYVKGHADRFIDGLVAASGIDVIVADDQPFSFSELEARQLRVHHALEALGYQDVVTGVNITGGGRIPAAVGGQGSPTKSANAIVASLPTDLQSSVDLTISSGSLGADTTSFGGMMVKKDGGNYATSGYSVTKISTGTTGVTTAGHASGADALTHPGHAVNHTFVFQSEHRGDWGDIEWHTTNFAEIAQFYADTGNVIYIVGDVEPRAGISVGESVCQYGRWSDDRDCLPDVHDVSIACTLSGVFNNRLVQMNVKTSIPGDSGGPWSFGATAYGSQKGWCQDKDAWSVADLFDEAIGVRVNTQ